MTDNKYNSLLGIGVLTESSRKIGRCKVCGEETDMEVLNFFSGKCIAWCGNKEIEEELNSGKKQNDGKQDKVQDTQNGFGEETMDTGKEDSLKRIWQKFRSWYAMGPR